MEVHHHSSSHGKKWTHYVWEFLMLFLAVFCGFLAENQREHVVEKKREKQFAASLLNDLRLDTAWLNTVTNSAKSKILNLDSVIVVLGQLKKNEVPVSIYQQLRRAAIQILFFPNNGTMTQLKNSGGMRLMHIRSVVDSIEAYDRLMRRLEMRRDITNEIAHDFTEVVNKVFIGKDLLTALYDSTFFHKDVAGNTVRLNDQYVNELINQSISLRIRAVSDTTANFSTKGSAVNLINFLREKYHLD